MKYRNYIIETNDTFFRAYKPVKWLWFTRKKYLGYSTLIAGDFMFFEFEETTIQDIKLRIDDYLNNYKNKSNWHPVNEKGES